MQRLLMHAIIVLIIIIWSVWQIVPPETTLRRAKDLNGGATLVYQVELKPTDAPDTMARLKDLLQRRIDPSGLLEITLTKVGDDRIEVTMPLPNDRVKALKADFERELAKLGDAPDSIGRLEAALKLASADRAAEIEKIGGGDAARMAQLTSAVDAYDRRTGLKEPYEAAERLADARAADVASAKTEEAKQAAEIELAKAQGELRAAAMPLADAEIAFNSAMQAIGSAGASPTAVRRALELPNTRKHFKSIESKKFESFPSPRERAVEAVLAANPGARDAITQVIAKWNEFEKNRLTLDDPADLKRIMRGAGVLTFRIAVRPGAVGDEQRLRQELRGGGPRAVKSTSVRWYKINKEDGWYETPQDAAMLFGDPGSYFAGRYQLVGDRGPDGSTYLLLHDEPGKRLTQAENNWGLAGARAAKDELGRDSISFQMDAVGGPEMSKLTGLNVGQAMAVLLDDEVYTAPTLQSRIGSSGQISGSFSREEINYIVRVLSAGSMTAKLSPEPISETVIGPELGRDNLARGMYAGVLAFALISAFMIMYYFSGGVIATFALAINLLLLLAVMAFNKATFSLPGIAGVVLAFGMAVDANVLIYERLREELVKGEPLRVAVRMAYNRALAPILDGNLTHLITSVVLYFTGTPEIRGFAITMSIGVVTTLFCQLYVTRIFYFFMVDKLRVKKVSMLPMAVPAVQRLLTLKFDWMRLSPIFFTISGVLLIASLVALFGRGVDILDTVFRGGTRVTIQLRNDPATGLPTTASRAEIQERIRAVVAMDPERLRELADTQVLVVYPDAQNRSGRFVIQTTLTDNAVVSEAFSKAFEGLLDQVTPLTFTGSELEVTQADRAPMVPIVVPNLIDLVPRLNARVDMTEFLGGAAILLENIGPTRPTLTSLEERLRALRSDRQFAETLTRPHKFVVVKGTPTSVESAVLLVRDDNSNYLKDSEGQRRWNDELRVEEWALVKAAVARSASFAGIERFDASIARTFQAQAIAAVILSTVLIVIYVWVRFSSLRYSVAAMIATLHDCILTLGAIAVAEYLFRAAPGVSNTIGLLPFKIDLNVIAAVLTILGYSLNDKIVIMDRIRENRGKLPYATRSLINASINQTISRTIMTGTTVLIASLVLYVVGGEALRSFAYCFIVGVIAGTYSSVAIAAPIVWSRSSDPTALATDRRPTAVPA